MVPAARFGGGLALLWLAGCATAPALPLAQTANLAGNIERLSVDTSQLRLAQLPRHRIDAEKGLSPTDVAILAVLNSPDLNARRAATKVSAAQAFAAGLLPDPQLGVTADFAAPGSGGKTAYGLSPTLDVATLITHSSALAAAKSTAKQADLDLLWAEWGAAQQARVLATTVLADETRILVLDHILGGLQSRSNHSAKAFAGGDVSAAVAGADQAAGLDAQAQLAAARQGAGKARGDLNALIGLKPETNLPLIPGPPATSQPARDIQSALAALPQRRPDLLALQAGYRAQNANVRKAVLAQFPLINLGFSRQSDNGGIKSNGLSGTLTLPLFNRGRGEIAIQSASRAQLLAEYQARLDQTVADVASSGRELEAGIRAASNLADQVPRLQAMSLNAKRALDRGDTDSASELLLEQAALKQELALADTTLAANLAQINLDTQLFLPDPSDLPQASGEKP